MSYNGIGLSTVRGSATNGFVQRNLGWVRQSDSERRRAAAADGRAGGGGGRDLVAAPMRQSNADIVAHDVKRRIELRTAELRIKLEDEGTWGADEIDTRCDTLRAQLIAEADAGREKTARLLPRPIPGDVTAVTAAAKEAELKRVRGAWGLSEGHVPGASFDREALEAKKMERRAANEERARKLEQDRGDKVIPAAPVHPLPAASQLDASVAPPTRKRSRGDRSRSRSGSLSYTYSSYYSYSGSSRGSSYYSYSGSSRGSSYYSYSGTSRSPSPRRSVPREKLHRSSIADDAAVSKERPVSRFDVKSGRSVDAANLPSTSHVPVSHDDKSDQDRVPPSVAAGRLNPSILAERKDTIAAAIPAFATASVDSAASAAIAAAAASVPPAAAPAEFHEADHSIAAAAQAASAAMERSRIRVEEDIAAAAAAAAAAVARGRAIKSWESTRAVEEFRGRGGREYDRDVPNNYRPSDRDAVGGPSHLAPGQQRRRDLGDERPITREHDATRMGRPMPPQQRFVPFSRDEHDGNWRFNEQMGRYGSFQDRNDFRSDIRGGGGAGAPPRDFAPPPRFQGGNYDPRFISNRWDPQGDRNRDDRGPRQFDGFRGEEDRFRDARAPPPRGFRRSASIDRRSRGRHSRSTSRSRSPRRRSRSYSRSRSSPRRRRGSRSPIPGVVQNRGSRPMSRSRSPLQRRVRSISRSRSPLHRGGRSNSRSRSPPRRTQRSSSSRSFSPPARRPRRPGRRSPSSQSRSHSPPRRRQRRD